MPTKSKQSSKKQKPKDGFRYPAKDLHKPVTKRDIDELFAGITTLEFLLEHVEELVLELRNDSNKIPSDKYVTLSDFTLSDSDSVAEQPISGMTSSEAKNKLKTTYGIDVSKLKQDDHHSVMQLLLTVFDDTAPYMITFANTETQEETYVAIHRAHRQLSKILFGKRNPDGGEDSNVSY